MARLRPLDAAFLTLEDADPYASLAIASVAVLTGPAPAQEEFVAEIGARLRAIPQARQKVRRVPLDLDVPRWVDDPHFDLGYHLRRTALPAPGDDAALHRLMARIMAQRLDRDRPLWECWVIEGLAGGRWAVLSKVHHCLVDGVGGTRLLSTMFGGMSTADTSDTEPAPGMVRLLVDAAVRLATNPARAVRLATAAIGGLATLASAVVPAAPSSLSGPIGRARRYRTARVALPDVLEVCGAFEVTVNDVVLTAVSSGFRTMLRKRGEQPAPDTVRSLVPVSVRVDGKVDNQISVLLPFLPVDVADPVEALTVVHSRLMTLKASGEREAGRAITGVARYEPFAPISMAIRLVGRLPQRHIVTVTTNVPGPREPLTVLGREIVELLPYVPIALRIRIGVAVLTYRDQLTIGITGDFDSVPDIDVLATAIEHGVAELVTASRQPHRQRRC